MNLIPNEDDDIELTAQEEMMLTMMDIAQQLNQVTAAYTVYTLLNPASKKLISRETFLNLYEENLDEFADLIMGNEEENPQLSMF